MSQAQRIRELVASPEILILPGVYDGLSARLVEKAGFEGAYITGGGASVSALGLPDFGLMTLTETALHVQRMTGVLDIPVIADADTGYGGLANVARTVRELERAGAGGFHLEDQVFPKRCGFLPKKEIVPAKDFVNVVKVAREAARDSDTVIIARTDSRAVEGLDAAIERAGAYAEAGADLVFIEALQSEEDVERVASEVSAPKVINMISSSPTPTLSRDRLQELGFAVAIYPIVALAAAANAIHRALVNLQEDGDARGVAGLWSPQELHEEMGVHAWMRIADAVP